MFSEFSFFFSPFICVYVVMFWMRCLVCRITVIPFFSVSQNRRKLFTVLLDVLSDHLATNNTFFIFFHKPNRFLSNQFLFVSSFSWCCLFNTYLKLYLLARTFYIRITFSNWARVYAVLNLTFASHFVVGIFSLLESTHLKLWRICFEKQDVELFTKPNYLKGWVFNISFLTVTGTMNS